MISLGQVARAIRYRAGASTAVLIVGAMAIGISSIGPLYARAGSESILRDTLINAATRDAGLHAQQLSPTGPTILPSFHALIDKTKPKGYGDDVESIYLNGNGHTLAQHFQTYAMKMVYRQGFCNHLVIDKGRCPTKPDEILAASRTAKDNAWTLGSSVVLRGFTSIFGFPGAGADSVSGTIVGLYHPRDAHEPYWFGEDYFHPYPGLGEDIDHIDSIFTVADTFYALGPQVQPWHVVDLTLQPSQIHLDDEGTLKRQEARFVAAVASGQTNVDSQLPDVLGRADSEMRLLKNVVLLVTLMLAILTFLVLFLIVASAAEDRGAEIALAKLRGHRLPTVIQIALIEPALLLAISAPVGLLAGRGLVGALADNLLASDTPVLIRTPTLLAVLGAFLGGLLAASLGVSNIIRRPIADQWQRTQSSSAGTAAFTALEIVLGVAAIGLIVQLEASGSLRNNKASSAALFIPAVLVLLAGLLGSRALPAAARSLTKRLGSPTRIGRFLALRLVSRRAIGARLTVLLAVSIGLATAAVDIALVASGNRAQRAATDVGAPIVLDVEGSSSLLEQVRSVDPDGRWAMAVAQWSSFGGPLLGNVLAADLKAFPNVAHWRRDFGAQPESTMLAALTAPAPAAIPVRNGPLSITASYSGTPVPMDINAEVTGPQGARLITIGHLTAGRHTFTATVDGCASDCILTAIRLTKEPDQYVLVRGTFTLHAITSGTAAGATADFANANAWIHIVGGQPQLDTGQVTGVVDGVRYDFKVPGADSAGLRRSPTPYPLPIAINPTLQTTGSPIVEDARAAMAAARTTGDVSVLPFFGDSGSLVNLEYLQALLPGYADYSLWNVWLGDQAPPDAVQRLAKAGIIVDGQHTVAQRRRELDRSGASLGILLFSYAAGAGALLAPAATAMAIFITARRRAFELAALMAVGVRRRALVRACLGEQLLVLGTGLLMGVVAGVIGAQIALPNVPEFSDNPVPPLQLAPHVVGVAAFIAGMTVLVIATAALAAFGLVRGAKPAVLREAG